jgi:hypothetical protein
MRERVLYFVSHDHDADDYDGTRCNDANLFLRVEKKQKGGQLKCSIAIIQLFIMEYNVVIAMGGGVEEKKGTGDGKNHFSGSLDKFNFGVKSVGNLFV